MSEAFALVRIRSQRKLARVREIEEIVPLLALTPLEAPFGSCRGMANLRGAVVPVFDLDGPDARLSPSRGILVCRTGEGLVGVIVDEVEDVLEIARERISTRTIGPARVITVARFGDDLLPVIEPQDVIDEGHARA